MPSLELGQTQPPLHFSDQSGLERSGPIRRSFIKGVDLPGIMARAHEKRKQKKQRFPGVVKQGVMICQSSSGMTDADGAFSAAPTRRRPAARCNLSERVNTAGRPAVE